MECELLFFIRYVVLCDSREGSHRLFGFGSCYTRPYIYVSSFVLRVLI